MKGRFVLCGSRRRLFFFFTVGVGFLTSLALYTYVSKHATQRPRYHNYLQEAIELKVEYEDTLREIPYPKYRDPNLYLDIGPPIGSLLNKTKKNGNNNNNDSVVTKRPKLVIQWTLFFGTEKWIPDVICPGEKRTCVVSRNKSDYLIGDAIMIHHADIIQLPAPRLPNQRWVYYDLEPPWLSRIKFSDYNGVFNWTSTYRWDSDFPSPYGNTMELEKPKTEGEFRKIFSDILSTKRKLVAIMASNCNAQSDRLSIVQQLKLFIPVDFYGKCGDLPCEKWSKKCDEILSTYKFYLSFENAKCRNYITEKVFNPLFQWNAVPIVYGTHNDDYARVLPPDSYIHVEGFSSIKKLAEYITLLSEHPGLYEKYHAWRRTHTSAPNTYLCDMCKALYNDSMPVKSYRDFQGWHDEEVCKCWSYTFTLWLKWSFRVLYTYVSRVFG